jgi:hypothetical protein
VPLICVCVCVFPTTYDPHTHTQAADTQAIAGSQDRAGTKPEAGSMEGNGKTRAASPCRDDNGKGTQKTTSVFARGGGGRGGGPPL